MELRVNENYGFEENFMLATILRITPLAMAASMVDVWIFFNTSYLPKRLDKQHRPRSDCFCRSSLIRVFPVCYSDNRLVNFSPDNQQLI